MKKGKSVFVINMRWERGAGSRDVEQRTWVSERVVSPEIHIIKSMHHGPPRRQGEFAKQMVLTIGKRYRSSGFMAVWGIQCSHFADRVATI